MCGVVAGASGYTQAPVPVTNLKITRCYGVTVLRRYGVMDCRKGPHLWCEPLNYLSVVTSLYTNSECLFLWGSTFNTNTTVYILQLSHVQSACAHKILLCHNLINFKLLNLLSFLLSLRRCLFWLTMQSYGDFLLIPRKFTKSSLTCSDNRPHRRHIRQTPS